MADISKLEEQTVQLDQETINKADLYKKPFNIQSLYLLR